MNTSNIIQNYLASIYTFFNKFKNFQFRKDNSKEYVDKKILEKEQVDQKENENPWIFCAVCKNKIANIKDKIEVDSKHYHTFLNPHGIFYNIRCFKKAAGCLPYGEPIEEYTWFPGYSWQIVLCSNCKIHNGWKYDSGKSTFFGLIDNRLIS